MYFKFKKFLNKNSNLKKLFEKNLRFLLFCRKQKTYLRKKDLQTKIYHILPEIGFGGVEKAANTLLNF